MRFHEKLDLLMNITQTKNSTLALYASLDASHISRLRRGQRSLSKNESYVKAMATYFAKHCTEEYQKQTLMNVLNVDTVFPDDHEQRTKLLHLWLLDEKINNSKTVAGFLDNISSFTFKTQEVSSTGNEGLLIPTTSVSVHYGIEGKRAAVIAFLSLVVAKKTPQTLYLFSDEDMGWLMESREFMIKWAALMSQVVMRGNKIKIIHTVNRDLDEMLAAIREWMPLYMTGSVEPYYYPKKRDGVFKRTLFIAPESAAVISTSVGSMTDKAANFFIKDKIAIRALVEEFTSYLILCRPLMLIFNSKKRQAFLETLTEFEKEEANAILKSDTLSTLTMPVVVAEQVLSRMKNLQKDQLIQYHKSRRHLFQKSLHTTTFIEIIKIPDITMIEKGRVRIALCDIIENEDLYYTAEEFRQHLENIVYFLQMYKNYYVYLATDIKEDGYLLYVKEELGVIVANITAPTVFFGINESNMTAAFWDFLHHKTGNICSLEKRTVINKLQKIINTLKTNS